MLKSVVAAAPPPTPKIQKQDLFNRLPPTWNNEKELGKKAQETFDREQSLTIQRLQDLHGSLLARPKEDEMAPDPRGLKVPLMAHQKHALAWMQWREQQKPRGGVLGEIFLPTRRHLRFLIVMLLVV